MVTNNFVKLALAQLLQKTLYCGGLDLHPFGIAGRDPDKNLETNLNVYKSFIKNDADRNTFKKLAEFYFNMASLLPGVKNARMLAELMAALETYLFKIVDILTYECNIRVFKPQSAFYEQFGPLGQILLARLCDYLRAREKELDTKIIDLLDCKRGDISTTQAAYFTSLIGNLQNNWGIDYAPYDFDIINVTPWMGKDVLVLKDDKGNPGLGLNLMQTGKGIIVVNKSSNPSGPDYQELVIEGKGMTLQMMNAHDLAAFSKQYDLEAEGLSTLGMVIGSTHPCDGSIRKAFPGATHLVPGFGAQGGKFNLIMPELITEGKWTGQGAIFSSSRGTMYPHLSNLGGSGDIKNLRTDLKTAVSKFRNAEKLAYEEFKIPYPFA